MSEIPKAYEPKSVEEKWYAFWQEHGCFTADPARVTDRRPAYAIVIPPPNVTGVLTLGHVLNNTIQDILARKARMDGREVLWLPGTDHAGIATQTVVERHLKKEGVLQHRNDLGREPFLERVWEWKEKHGGIIIHQLKKIGASCDWSRERFTMDPEYSRCVQNAFVSLYRKGLIYRGRRMVNWCPVSLTALSDEEVIMKEQKGFLYHFRVEVVEEPGTFLTIATTRPETIPADTAVAVHPGDPRYAHLIGKHVRRPLPVEKQTPIPILGDAHIDPQFGTGVLKVTPAHDRADFDIGQRHQLPVLDVLNPDGTLNTLAGAGLAGLDRMTGRQRAAELLESIGALDKAEPYVNNVGFSERADVPIEPRLSEQWFLRYPAVDAARACVRPGGSEDAATDTSQSHSTSAPPTASGPLRFFPGRWAKVYDHWMDHLQDWCISRQLWWGHRIPVWYRRRTSSDPGIETRPDTAQPAIWCDVQPPPDPENWEQDPDVLDTWFSSWLWPFATMGWTGNPDRDAQNATLRTFFPTTDLVTGPDILFFWVARMIMAGYEFMGEVPFRNVYFTGIVRDRQGRKMSKSLGNSPDPLVLVDRYGADALRFGVMRSAPLGQDVIYDEGNVELGRNFCNKLWNACRFRQLQGGAVQAEIQPELLTHDDRWILLRLDQAIAELDLAYAGYRFNEVTQILHRFFWSEYCDWYIEASKAAFAADPGPARANKLAVIDFVLSHTLRLFHPVLPFITEELWHGLGYAIDMPPQQGGTTIMNAPWPKPLEDEERALWGLEPAVDTFAAAKFELVTLGRNLRAQFQIPANRKARFILRPAGALPPDAWDTLRILLNAAPLDPAAHDWTPERGTPSVGNALGDLFLPLAGLVDPEIERTRLTRELEKVRAEIAKVEERLANPDFTAKVPPKVLEEHRQRLADWRDRSARTQAALAQLP
ncbi:MAG: valine--tRNA ligase [Verrucomicrobiae bacterium]|nr:valine--tRNA ligase [Verrucomicrobiae bacterium]